MKRATLSTSIEAALRALFERLRSERGLSIAASSTPWGAYDIAALLEEHDPAHISWISAQMRHVLDNLLWEFYGHRGSSYDAGHVANLAAREAGRLTEMIFAVSPDAAIAFTVAHSGHAREAAVKALTKIRGPFGLALLLLRVNDWVPEVRQAARLKLATFVETPGASGLDVATMIACMDLLLDPRRFGRISTGERSSFTTLLQYPGAESTLHKILLHSPSDCAPRYLVFGLQKGMFTNALVDLAAQAKHSRVRRVAVQAVLQKRYSWKDCRLHTRDIEVEAEPDEVASRALHDPSVEVQRVALQYIIENRVSQHYNEKTFRAFLHGRNNSLAERAAFGLKSLGIDILEELRHELTLERPHPSSIYILGNYGAEGDGVLIYEARTRVGPRHRIPLLAAASRLGNHAAIQELQQIVWESTEVLVARHAARALQKAGQSFSFEELRSAIARGVRIIDRGLLPFARQLPAIQLTRVIVAMIRADMDCDYEVLWRVVARKRCKGMFLPKQAELAELSAEVEAFSGLAAKVERVLGIEIVGASHP